jgi:hypothetical protein
MATRNRYQEIMAQFQQAQPYSITDMPSSYYEDQSGYSGGYDNTPYVEPVEQLPYVGLIDQYTGVSGGGGGRGTPSDDSGGFTEPTSDQAYNVSKFGENIKYVSPLVGGLASMYGNYLASQVNPNYSNEGRNYPSINGGVFGPDAISQAISQQDAANARDGGGNAYGGGGVATGGNDGDASGGGDRGTRGGFAHGGHVSMMHLLGPDPEGPDDGYATLKDGEFVINDKAVKKYGIELMNAINSGKISKGKLLGLLEM